MSNRFFRLIFYNKNTGPRGQRSVLKPLFHFSQKERKKSLQVGPGTPKIDPKSKKIGQKSLPEGLGHRATGTVRRASGNGRRATGIGLVARGPLPEGPARGVPKSPGPGSRILKQIYIYVYICICMYVCISTNYSLRQLIGIHVTYPHRH